MIRPFREVAYTEYVEIEIPQGVQPGNIVVVVRGGSSEDDAEVYTIVDKVGETEGVALVDMLEAIEGAEQNNELIIEIRYALDEESTGTDEGYVETESEEEEPLYSAGIVISEHHKRVCFSGIRDKIGAESINGNGLGPSRRFFFSDFKLKRSRMSRDRTKVSATVRRY